MGAYPNCLAHYGILGMKWGVRRYQNPDGTLTFLGKKHYGSSENFEKGVTKKQAKQAGKEEKKAREAADKEAKKARAEAVANRRNLSTAELNALIERIETEKKLVELTKDDLTPGVKTVEKIFSSIVDPVIANAARGSLAYVLNEAISKKDADYKVDYSKAASYVAPNPNKKK